MAKAQNDGTFSEIVKKLKIADELIVAHEKNVAKILSETDVSPEERQSQLMETFNRAIRSFKELDKELFRHIKRAKEQMRREKDRVITKIYQ